jgi:chemotaxis protein methyltransferase CheR
VGLTILEPLDNRIDSEDQGCEELEKIEIEILLEAIYRHYGYDFRNYVFSSIRRRVRYRMKTENLSSVSGLQEKVLHDPKMMEKLFIDFSINVTEMFRDPDFFLSFRRQVIPVLKEYPYIRIWHAGCSSGEEVYSMAILLHEEGLLKQSRIYATDINETVLKTAKKGIFPINKMQAYTKNYLKAGGTKAFSEYYSVKQDQVMFHSALSENVIFAQHNLVTDGSFNEFHVIICRNVMIYFNKELQNHVHQLFYQSLCRSGFLGLGNKEGITFTNQAKYYEEIDSAEKIYQKVQ